MNNHQIDTLIKDYFEVVQAILQLNFILSLINNEIVRLSSEGNNEEEIEELIQASFVIKQVILQLTSILLLIKAEIVRLETENAA